MSININADTTNGLVMTSDTSGELKLQSAGADIATVSSSGIAMAAGKTLPASALTGSFPVIDASTSGIYLGGTASTNLLDDYEEGTFTPGWTGSTGAPTISYTEQHGYYIKVGDLVNVWGFILVSSISGGGGQIWITGLPFAVADTIPATTIDGGGGLSYFTNWGSTRSHISASPINGSATMRLYQIAGGGGNAYAATSITTDITNTTSVRFWGIYKAT